jgi:hypothetical protein
MRKKDASSLKDLSRIGQIRAATDIVLRNGLEADTIQVHVQTLRELLAELEDMGRMGKDERGMHVPGHVMLFGAFVCVKNGVKYETAKLLDRGEEVASLELCGDGSHSVRSNGDCGRGACADLEREMAVRQVMRS